jgi:hypothetical protein
MKPPHANRVVMLSCECSADEREVLDRMKTAVLVKTDANLVRIALWSLADHLELEMGPSVFDLRKQTQSGPRDRVRRTPNPKIRQDRPYRQPKPAPDHPWRRRFAPARKVGA